MKSDFPKQVMVWHDRDGVLLVDMDLYSPDEYDDGVKVAIYEKKSEMVVKNVARFEPLAAKRAKKGVGRGKAKSKKTAGR